MVNLAIPMRAGEAARVVALARSANRSTAEVASTVVVERLFESLLRVSALGGAIVFGLGLEPSPLTIVGGIATLVVGFLLLWWAVRNKPTILDKGAPLLGRLPRVGPEQARRWLSRLVNGLSALASPRQLLQIMAWSAAAWALFWLFHYLVLLSLPPIFADSERLPLSLAALGLAPPSAPAQPGIYHASVVVPLAMAGLDRTSVTAYAVLLHAVSGGWMIALGLLGLLLSRRKEQESRNG
jgi:uncharacterized protein (TIRG00374 family)